MRIRILGLCVAVVMLSGSFVFGQCGVSSMSYGAANAGINLDYEAVKVEEFINYHRHQLPLPHKGERIHLDLQMAKLPNGRVGLQVGLTTRRATDRALRKPLNLVMVIDRSGSMSGERIKKVKQSLQMLIEQLSPRDFVSIVSFNESATVDLCQCDNSDMQAVSKAIDKICAGGSTNLHGGLMLGYKQAKKNFDKERSNRVILLTDGRANVGTIDPDEIAGDSKEFNKKGIELSAVGLGHSFNHQLLRQLALAGRGAVHFVDNPEGMQKVFVDEFDSLLSEAARKLKVEIDFGDADHVQKIYGYAPQKNGSTYVFKPDNMGHGATQVILAELDDMDEKVKVELSYLDCSSDQKQTTTETIEIDFERAKALSENRSMRKNFSIGKVADSIRKSAKLCSKKEYEKSRKKLSAGIKYAKKHFDSGDDKDVDRVVKLAKERRDNIRKAQEELEAQPVATRKSRE